MAEHQLLHLASVVAAAREWGAHHLKEAQITFTHLAVRVELLWGDETVHRQVLRPG